MHGSILPHREPSPTAPIACGHEDPPRRAPRRRRPAGHPQRRDPPFHRPLDRRARRPRRARGLVRGDDGGGDPILIADVDGRVAGYGTYGPWRRMSGYRYSVEDSVYVREGFQGRGIGRALVEELIAHARAAGKRAMFADIEAGNAGSIRLHERLGFRRVGLLPGIGTSSSGGRSTWRSCTSPSRTSRAGTPPRLSRRGRRRASDVARRTARVGRRASDGGRSRGPARGAGTPRVPGLSG
ncbi:N-acetyltransferase family protein [Clavibacter zhangzhiyongii]|uniref:GNAT family N-acetyltransferase n=1 Tax=Clavibacter zhangzhiyongii TaxID=2768071 RepID=UPI0039E1767F